MSERKTKQALAQAATELERLLRMELKGVVTRSKEDGETLAALSERAVNYWVQAAKGDKSAEEELQWVKSTIGLILARQEVSARRKTRRVVYQILEVGARVAVSAALAL